MSEDNFNDDKINEIISKNISQKKQLSDVLYSATDMITKIHNLKSMMIETISDPQYLSQLTPEQWALINESLTNSEATTSEFLNTQARIAEKLPVIQNSYSIIAGQINTQNIAQKSDEFKEEKTFEIPKEIMPIQQAIQSTMDSRFNIDREEVLRDYEQINKSIIDITPENTDE